MGSRILKTLSYFLVIALFAAPLGGAAFVLTKNTISLQNIGMQIEALDYGTSESFSIAADIFRSHRKVLVQLRASLAAQRADLELQGALTDELIAYYDAMFKETSEQLSALNIQIEKIERALAVIKEASDDQAQAETREKAVYDKSLQATVFVLSEYYDSADSLPKKDKEGNKLPFMAGSGSGTIFKVANGKTYVLTAAHVVDEYVREVWKMEGENWVSADRTLYPTITLNRFHLKDNEVEEYSAKVVILDNVTDLAILVIEDYESPYVAEIASAEDIENIALHDEVYITGSPLGVTPRLSKGDITAWIHAKEGYIEASCDLIWGNSGGAMFKNGKIIGVVSLGRLAQYQMVESLGLCISPKVINEFVELHAESMK